MKQYNKITLVLIIVILLVVAFFIFQSNKKTEFVPLAEYNELFSEDGAQED